LSPKQSSFLNLGYAFGLFSYKI